MRVYPDMNNNWAQQKGVVRAVRLLDGSDMFAEAYDSSLEHAIVTSAGQLDSFEVGGQDFADGEFDQTDVVGGDVQLTHKSLALSFVVDGSGSAGWNDRSNRRSALVKKIIQWLPSVYPESVVFDAVTFGGKTGAISSIASNRSSYAAIILNLWSATKYNPDGTITTTEPGDNSLSHIVAYGIKGLEPSHRYVLGSIIGNEVVIESSDNISGVPLNMQSIGPSGNPVTFTTGNDGPGATEAVQITVPAGGSSAFRKAIGSNRPLKTSKIMQAANAGEVSLYVDDITGYSPSGQIEIIDQNISLRSQGYYSMESSGKINLSAALPYAVDTAINTGGFIQETVDSLGIDFSKETGLKVYLRDSQVTKAVTFFLETADGSRLEWSITPFREWIESNLAFLDETMELQLSLFDQDGEPYPDGSEIELFVDGFPDLKVESTTITAPPLVTPQEGDQYVALDAKIAGGVKIGSTLTFVGSNGQRGTGYVIWKIDRDTGRVWVLPVVGDLGFTTVSIEIEEPVVPESGETLPVKISAVDVTPIVAGRNISWVAGDPPPVDNGAELNDYNQDSARRLDNSFSIPTIYDDDFAKASLRVLPIPVDSLAEPDLTWLNPPLTQEDVPEDDLEAVSTAAEDLISELSESSDAAHPLD